MKRKREDLLPGFRLKLLLSGMVLVCLLDGAALGTTRKDVDLLISSELPVGSSRAQVIRFLRSEKWEYSELGETINAIVRDTARDLVIRTDTEIQFKFDKHGELTSSHLKDVYTGP